MSQSSYQTNDGLSSEPAQLVVRHPPAEPRIYTDGRTFASEKQLSVLADREQVLTCESRGGNPAPLLTWWLGDIKLEASQRNESAASPDIKQWTAVSSLVHTFTCGNVSYENEGMCWLCSERNKIMGNEQ